MKRDVLADEVARLNGHHLLVVVLGDDRHVLVAQEPQAERESEAVRKPL